MSRPLDPDPTPRSWPVLLPHFDDCPEGMKSVGLAPLPRRTALQIRKLRRDAVIGSAARLGFSQRLLADVFGLPRSRIAAIVAKFDARYPKRDA